MHDPVGHAQRQRPAPARGSAVGRQRHGAGLVGGHEAEVVFELCRLLDSWSSVLEFWIGCQLQMFARRHRPASS
jgi:hypothetical protein